MGVLLAQDDNSRPIQVFGLGAAQDVAIGAVSTQSAAFTGDSRIIMISSDVSCRIATGVNPTALANGPRLVGGTTLHLKVEKHDKIAVIQESGPVTLSVTECT